MASSKKDWQLNKEWLALGDDEDVLYWEHPSLFKFGKDIIFSFVMVIIGFYAIYMTHFGGIELTDQMLQYAQYGSYLAVLMGFTFAGITLVKYFRQFYVVTSERLISKTQIINNNPDYIPLNKVQMTRIRQQNLGMDEVLGYGHVFISTAATATEESSLFYVPKPYNFKKAIEQGGEYSGEPEKFRELIETGEIEQQGETTEQETNNKTTEDSEDQSE